MERDAAMQPPTDLAPSPAVAAAASPAKRKPHVDRCLNCGAETPGAFCSACGQEAVDASISVSDHLADFLAEVVSLEARLPRTLATLVTRPGALTRAYNAGQRVAVLSPLKLYLFASVLYFLLASLAPAAAPVQIRDDHGAVTDAASLERLFAETRGAIPPFAQAALRRVLLSPEGFYAALLDTLSKATLLLVPLHAVLLKGLYRRPPRLYAAHLVFSFHLHAFAYLALALGAAAQVLRVPGSGALAGLLLLVVAGYAILSARTAYQEGALRSALKTAVAAVGYGLAFALVFAVTAAIAALRT